MEKINFSNGQPPAINGTNLNQMQTNFENAIKELYDVFHPVGSYYETSDTNFDPNISWSGTWVLDSKGKITVSQDEEQEEFAEVGQTGGEKTHNHTLENGYAQLKTNKGSATAGYVSKAVESYTTDVKFYTDKMASGDTETMSEGVQLAGSTDASSSLQPYIVVMRWHRTA